MFGITVILAQKLIKNSEAHHKAEAPADKGGRICPLKKDSEIRKANRELSTLE
jgi:hypothetical protein